MKNSEEYLTHAANVGVAELFEPAGHDLNENGLPLSEKLRARVGYPTQKALRRDGKAIGQCLPSVTSAGGYTEIFVSPVHGIGSPLRGPNGEHVGEDTVFILATLMHEVAHAVVGNGIGGPHGPQFAKVCADIGLDGPAQATVPGPAFKTWADSYIKRFGKYNHHAITIETLPHAGTKLLKVVCINPGCPTQPRGYPTRATWKWIFEFGCDFCACCLKRKGVYLPRIKGQSGKGAGDQDPGAEPVAIGPGGEGIPEEYLNPGVDFVTDPDDGDGEGEGEPQDGEPGETEQESHGGDAKSDKPGPKRTRDSRTSGNKKSNGGGTGDDKAATAAHPIDLDCTCSNCKAARELAGIEV